MDVLTDYEKMMMIEDAIERRLERFRQRLKKRARIQQCEYCKREFVSFSKKSKYCSHTCAQAVYYLRKTRNQQTVKSNSA